LETQPAAHAAHAGAVQLALTTEVDAERAEALAEILLEQGLAACVALLPLRSLYSWEGQLQRSPEVQLLIKTSPDQLAALEAVVHQRHSYSTPEWLHWRAGSSEAYGTWVAQSCGLRPQPPGG
jgi:periplasmic divalent cation tolerance protein